MTSLDPQASVRSDGNGHVVLESAVLRVTLTPANGADISSVRHLPTDSELLWRTPYRRDVRSLLPTDSMGQWLQSCEGGWQLVLPNGGAQCRHQGVEHLFHGEASQVAWGWAIHEGAVTLTTDLFLTPLSVVRRVALTGPDTLSVSTAVTNTAPFPVELMWGEHIGFGQDLLDDSTRVHVGSADIVIDDLYDDPSNPLMPGATGRWPLAPTARSTSAGSSAQDPEHLDLRVPLHGRSALAYLSDIAPQEISLTSKQRGVRATVSWSSEPFQSVWLWEEIEGSTWGPWFGRTRVIGIEPFSSWPSQGLAAVAEKTGTQLTLGAGQTIDGLVRLHVAAV